MDAGFNAIDTADAYSRWVPGHEGGESEAIIGEWLKASGRRDDVLILTKVGSDMGQGHNDLSPAWIETAVEDSLRRLQTDYIDLYQSHWPDPNTPQEETLEAFDRLVKAGKVRAIGTSNHGAGQVREALDISAVKGWARYETLQPHYNLYSRKTFEGPLQELAVSEGQGVITYFSLEAGFLTGKYASAAEVEGTAREGMLKDKFDARGGASSPPSRTWRLGRTRRRPRCPWPGCCPAPASPRRSSARPRPISFRTRCGPRA